MKKSILLLNATLVNEGRTFSADVLVKDGFIERIGSGFAHLPADITIDAAGTHLLPGVIDDQVHFREPGLTYKADLHSESRAAVAGGVTSFMEMPNTVPNTLTQALLADKYALAAQKSLANYSFFMGASNDNLAEIVKTNPRDVCGIKVFMGSSTGNMLVDNEQSLRALFRESPMLIAAHCEDEATVRANAEKYRHQYGEEAPAAIHPLVRNEAACLRSSSFAVALAKEYNTQLHILHISTADELPLFTNAMPLGQKRITAEVCVHHLWFDAGDYERLGNRIKCNPAIKGPRHKQALFEALLDDRLDIIATDHAPHTQDEKTHGYWQSHAGLPLVQHPLLLMLEFYHRGKIALPKVVEKMCHAPATLFGVERRGYLWEGYWADLVLVELEGSTTVSRENIHYKCGWSPLEGTTFRSAITHTIVSGHLAYARGQFDESETGKRLLFNR